jgi:hypothetical protein
MNIIDLDEYMVGPGSDFVHERKIAEAKAELLAARTRMERRAAGERFSNLIRMRSPEQVERMERRKGLCK